MKRRDFITILGGAAAWPGGARAQHLLPLVGLLANVSATAKAPQVAGFRNGLREAGYIEGRNIALEYRWADGQFDRLPGMAADLVRRHAAVIFVNGLPGAQALKAETTTIPVVFSIGEDPVKEGLVASLSRPGSNITGFTNFQNLLGGKKLSLLRDTLPKPISPALLVNPTNPNAEPDKKDLQAAAGMLGLHLRVFEAKSEPEIETAFSAMRQVGANALYINTDPVFQDRRDQIAALAIRDRIPTMSDRREFPVSGCLMSYAGSETESFRQCGVYVGRILKGELPANLPVQQASKFEFVINLKTARALGLRIPPGILAIADEIIE
jgi:putative ABC transport system substrate-binding protein